MTSKYAELRDSIIEAKLRPPAPPNVLPQANEALLTIATTRLANGSPKTAVKVAATVKASPSKPRPIRTEHIIWGTKLVVTNSREPYLRVVFKKGSHRTPRPVGTGKSPGVWFHRLRPGQNPYREALLQLRNPDAAEVVLAIEFGA